MSTYLLTTPIKSHPHKLNYCDLFFAMPTALAKFTKVKLIHAKHNSITVYVVKESKAISAGMKLVQANSVGLP